MYQNFIFLVFVFLLALPLRNDSLDVNLGFPSLKPSNFPEALESFPVP